MTSVYLERDGRDYLVSCKGHASGDSRVCAGVSALICTLAGWLDCSGTPYSRREIGDGAAIVKFRGDCRQVFDFISVGFLQLAQTFPQQVEAELRDTD